MSAAALDEEERSIVIVGAGFAGIAIAIKLKGAGFKNFKIIEKANDVGGTWRDNTYPGCTSDISIHYYTLSTDLHSDWNRTCETQPNIQAYIKKLFKKYELESHICFNSRLLSAKWAPSLQGYEIVIENSKRNHRNTIFANILVSAHGLLHIPKLPAIPGLNDFTGKVMHTAQWDRSVELHQKRVAVIGNGGSGTQVVAKISQLPHTEVVHFIRNPNWILPASILTIHPLWKWIFGHVSLVMRLYRWSLFWTFELLYLLIFKHRITRYPLRKLAEYFMTRQSPKEFHSLLVPSYPLGCRRIVFDDGYLASLNQENVSLGNGGEIVSAVPHGLVMRNGDVQQFDVIVCATGFETVQFPYELRGVTSTIQEYYDAKDGPEAYLGATVPGFPNFYMLNGPNTATGYTSVLFFCETEVNYIMKLIQPVLQNRVSSFEVTQEANDIYNKKLQTMLDGTIFTFCGSWYRVGSNGKNISIFPGSALTFWYWCRNVNWDHYKVGGPTSLRKAAEPKLSMMWFKSVTVYVVLGLVVTAWTSWVLHDVASHQ
ncbi:FAD/NAD(P)-binding domain-containing protein [Agrocybe pediades]|nr:FAD/NAD(P)-binding domain-containing protein [Agrocybe pediades]